jgi:hypothetical protein
MRGHSVAFSHSLRFCTVLQLEPFQLQHQRLMADMTNGVDRSTCTCRSIERQVEQQRERHVDIECEARAAYDGRETKAGAPEAGIKVRLLAGA